MIAIVLLVVILVAATTPSVGISWYMKLCVVSLTFIEPRTIVTETNEGAITVMYIFLASDLESFKLEGASIKFVPWLTHFLDTETASC